ncbi:phage tail tape measure protein [Kitasatospora sp. NPDC097605]|uniref:phage tail tape measure protein n=1 Tax=Kitasatospora sp. NPDC097605 TaxID=3157226 RepID=UPI003321D40A
MGAEWNLLLRLKGDGRDMANALQQAGRDARALGRDTASGQRGVRALGEESQRSSRRVRDLGTDAQYAGTQQRRAGDLARQSGSDLRAMGRDAQYAGTQQRRAGDYARQAGTDVRAFGQAAATGQRGVRSLGDESQRSSRRVRDLGTDAQYAGTQQRRAGDLARQSGSDLRAMGRDAQYAGTQQRQAGEAANTAAARVREHGQAANTAATHLRETAAAGQSSARSQRSVATSAQAANAELRGLVGALRSATREVRSLDSAASSSTSGLRRIGDAGDEHLGRVGKAVDRVKDGLLSMGSMLAGGALIMGAHDVLEAGNEYQQGLNTFGAVTNANRVQMVRAAAAATQLGGDLKLPTATSADAAESMVELAKAGFRTEQAIDASRASLQLSAAANLNAADTAKYLGDMMDQFGLGADQASRAADILAATANNASGDIVDIYYSMKYAGPVAHSLGIGMEEAASAVGMMGKAGILGSTAGTALRGILTNMAKPSKAAAAGLKTLGIEAWDTEGRFKGLRYVVERLQDSAHTLSEKDFTAAIGAAFGKPAMGGAMALAHQGLDSFDALNEAVRQSGAAAQIAEAKGKGLAGAMTQLKTQVKQTGIELYTEMSPGLEWATRGMTRMLSEGTPALRGVIAYGHDLVTLYGPEVAAQFRSGLGKASGYVNGLGSAFKDAAFDVAASVLHALFTAARAGADVLRNVGRAVEPIVRALGSFNRDGQQSVGVLDLLVTGFDYAADGIVQVSRVLVPIGQGIGHVISLLGELPWWAQGAIASMLLARRVGPVLDDVGNRVGGHVTGAWRGLGDAIAYQRRLADDAGQSLGRFGGAMAALESRIPIVGQMGAAFRDAHGRVGGFTGGVLGAGSAITTGLVGAGKGLVNFLGGPWGVVMLGAGLALSMLARHQQQAAQAAQEHQQRVKSLTSALRDSGGVVDDNVRKQAAMVLMDTKVKDGKQKLVETLEKAGVSMGQLTDAYLGQGGSLQALQDRLKATAEANKTMVTTSAGATYVYNDIGLNAKRASDALGDVKGDLQESIDNVKRLAEAQRNGASDGSTAFDKLKKSVQGLADKTGDADQRTRSLKEALDILNGGQVSMQAAEARLNAAILAGTDAIKDGIESTEGWGKSLIDASGALTTTSRNGQTLYNNLNSITDATTSASVQAFEFAKAHGENVTKSIQAAADQMAKGRSAAIDLARSYGLTEEEAGKVADSLGLIPNQVALLLKTEGVDSTLADLLAVQSQVKAQPKAVEIKVEALSEQAQVMLRSLGLTVETIPGTRQVKISAITDKARADLEQVIVTQSGIADKTITMDAKTFNAISGLTEVQRQLRATNDKSVTVHALTAEAQQALKDLGFKVTTLPGGEVKVTAKTDNAQDNIDKIQGALNGLRNKTVTVTVNEVAGTRMRMTQANRDIEADGGIREAFANGGIRAKAFAGGGLDAAAGRRLAQGANRERHIAQIARPGTWRVWAEDETGGEAYIPLAASKRGRSEKILDEVARRFGGQVVYGLGARPRAYADGGLAGQAPRSYATARPTMPQLPAPLAAKLVARPTSTTVVVVRDQAQGQPLIGQQTINVQRPGASEREIASAVSYQVRRAQRAGGTRR